MFLFNLRATAFTLWGVFFKENFLITVSRLNAADGLPSGDDKVFMRYRHNQYKA